MKHNEGAQTLLERQSREWRLPAVEPKICIVCSAPQSQQCPGGGQSRAEAQAGSSERMNQIRMDGGIWKGVKGGIQKSM